MIMMLIYDWIFLIGVYRQDIKKIVVRTKAVVCQSTLTSSKNGFVVNNFLNVVLGISFICFMNKNCCFINNNFNNLLFKNKLNFRVYRRLYFKSKTAIICDINCVLMIPRAREHLSGQYLTCSEFHSKLKGLFQNFYFQILIFSKLSYRFALPYTKVFAIWSIEE